MNYKKEIYGLIKDIEVTEQRIKLLVESSKEHRTFVEKVAEKYDINLERRLDGMNQFKKQLEDQKGTFITRHEVDAIKSGYEVFIKQMGEKYELSVTQMGEKFNQLSGSNRERISKLDERCSKLESSAIALEKMELQLHEMSSRVGKSENTMSNWSGRFFIIGGVYGLVLVILTWFLSHK